MKAVDCGQCKYSRWELNKFEEWDTWCSLRNGWAVLTCWKGEKDDESNNTAKND